MSEPTTTTYLGKMHSEAIDMPEAIDWYSEQNQRGVVPPPPKWVRLDCAEFTSHCPVTAQPDFGRIVIEYQPQHMIVETKSLKLWLWSFRGKARFNERIVAEICEVFTDVVEPYFVRVTGHFNARGGISVSPVSTWGEERS